MDRNAIWPEVRVKTTKLEKAPAIIAASKNLGVRREGVTGTVVTYVPGHSREAWFVKHDGSQDVGVYNFGELEPA